MSLTKRPILSHPDPTRPEPWVDFDIDLTAMTATIRTVTGPAASGLCTEEQERALVGTWGLGFDPTEPLEVHVLAIAMDGTLLFRPTTKMPEIMYAHLAWINPETGMADALEFVDGREFVILEDGE